nr:MAG TPA: hypothetical protein [Caudoviricetes sp.]DAZ09059.1 MAG TPA: hypothetical protein [Caudoviricetes sp.]
MIYKDFLKGSHIITYILFTERYIYFLYNT